MSGLARTDIPMAVQDGDLEVRATSLDDTTSVAWVRLPAGTDLRPALVGLPDDLCACPHLGFMIKGRLVMHTKDGDHTYEAGQVFTWPSGHAPEALEDCEYVDFSPTEQFTPVLRHLTGQS